MMIKRMLWVDRVFTFGIPPGWMPDIVERLAGTEARIVALTEHLLPKTLTHKPAGSWSIKEHIGHLIDLESLHIGRVEDFHQRKPILRAADMQNRRTNAANHNAVSLEELITRFQSLRTDFLEGLAGLDDQVLLSEAVHPRLQVAMKPVDLAFFTAEHDDHHLATIRALTEGRSF